MQEWTHTLADWIAIDSTSGREADYGEAVACHLRALGLDVELHAVAPGRANVLARAGAPRVLFCTHLDTVPPFFGPRITRDAVHGRGACDAKGQALAMAIAITQLVKSGQRDIGLLLTVGEEVDGAGAQAASAALCAGRLCDGRAPEHTVIGEPTGGRFVSAHKGIVKARLVASGTLSHSSQPAGPSAVHRLVCSCARLVGTSWGEHPLLGSGSMNIGTIGGGRASNVVADAAEADVMVRAVEPPERVIDLLRAALEEGVEIELGEHYGPVEFHVPEGEKAVPVAFATDAPFLANFGRRLLIGPGRIEDAHTDHERLTTVDFESGARRFEELARRLLGAG